MADRSAVAVSFRQVSRHYGEVRAADNLSFDIADGEFFAIDDVCTHDGGGLVVGRDGPDGGELLGLSLTSKDHDRDAEDEARQGRYWMERCSNALLMARPST